jgi:hypothetical protein
MSEESSTNPLLGVIVFLLGFFFYFTPAFIARGKYKGQEVFWLNLLAGWTAIGWIGALYWAITMPRRAPEPILPVARTTPADELTKLAQLHAAGQLTDEEFTRAKSRLL